LKTILVFSATILLLLSGCSAFRKKEAVEELPGFPAKHIGADYAFEMKFPSTWKIGGKRYMAPNEILLATCPPKGKDDFFEEEASVRIERISGPMDTDEFFRTDLEFARELLQDFEIHRAGWVKSNNLNWRWELVSYTIRAVKVKIFRLVAVRNGIVYLLAFRCQADQFDDAADDFLSIAQSFRLISEPLSH